MPQIGDVSSTAHLVAPVVATVLLLLLYCTIDPEVCIRDQLLYQLVETLLQKRGSSYYR